MERLKLEADIAGVRVKEAEYLARYDEITEQLADIDKSDVEARKKKRYELYEARDKLDDHEIVMAQLLAELAKLTNPGKKLQDNSCTLKQEVDCTDNVCEGVYTDSGNYISNTNTHRSNGNYSLARSIKPRKYRKGDDICTFLERFEQFIVMNRITDDNLDLYFVSLVEDDVMYKKLRNVRLTNIQKSDVRLLVVAVKEALYPATETRLLRSTLATLKQEVGESIEVYAQRIKDVADRAYSEPVLKEEASLSTLLAGISEVKIRQKLLEDDIDSFEKATRLAVKCERISKALNSRESFDVPLDVEAPVFRVEQSSSPSPVMTGNCCSKCGKSNHTEETCWRDVTCQLCLTKGHVASVCRASTPSFDVTTRGNEGVSRGVNVICYGCGERGHYRYQCTARTVGSREQRSTYRQDAPSFSQRAEQRNYLNGSAAGQYPIRSSRRRNQW